MKKFIYALVAVVMVCVTSCSKDDDVTKNYNLNVTLNLPEGTSIDDITEGTVTATNTQTGREFKQNDIKLSYEFTVPGGIYDISVALRSNKGTEVLAYNGAKLGADVYEDTSVSVDLKESAAGGLVFSEVYYNMVKPNGKSPYMADQFMEIYNNSDEVLYLDNCIIGILEGSQGTVPSVWVDENGELMNKYPLTYYTIAFVGDGKKYPINPGQAIVIAGQAQNHTAITTEMYDPTNEAAKISPVNLENANYEVCLTDYKPDKAIDNPNVPNMDIIFHFGSQNYFTLPYTGNAIILAKLPEDPYKYAENEDNYMYNPKYTTTGPYLMIPQEYVLDGINIVNNADKLNQQVIRLRPEVDAGKIFNEAAYCGLAIRRKVAEVTEEGRAILSDTNNSTEDFIPNVVPTPGIIPSVVD
ncbi:MAG: DUF4876 domain-containing protein [Muribaculaceae bacterium]|nr:DUF4876 domain-containing protein [Muribaculaceae bacterium]MDE5845045.1 DUF4876 domain-containing protein [Muribaculaceae bacterium]MDE7369884.1 DUF4876 domain-containing protein [Muribaculaceae bacterium]